MQTRRWRDLVGRLTDLGHQSDALERLRAHLQMDQGADGIEVELHREMAFALGRSGAKVDAALLELEELATVIRAAKDPSVRVDGIRRFNESRRLALRALEDLKIHREAVGLPRHKVLERTYPIPPPWPEDEEAGAAGDTAEEAAGRTRSC
ncbi:MAG TPA: hypothetical protein RMG48_15500 [Myxococcales bacterium LLY-WYZ-16_1]|nr:hypothetical protein [Myxococcales bacterium LLY-WYZ-16_1]